MDDYRFRIYFRQAIVEALNDIDATIERMNDRLYHIWCRGEQMRLMIYQSGGDIMISSQRIKPFNVSKAVVNHDQFIKDLRVILEFSKY